MTCPECSYTEIYVDDEFYDDKVHILTRCCDNCCCKFEEIYNFAGINVITKGNGNE